MRFLLLSFILLLPLYVFSDEKLSGTIIGTEVSVDYSTGSVSTTINNRECAFDGDFDTFFASFARSNTWIGLDLGSPHIISRVGWSPRNDATYGPARVQLALFEGANREDFRDAVPLYLIDEQSSIGRMHYADVHVSRGFRYVRYVGPNDVRCNIAEVEFYGHEGEGDDSQFYQVTNLPTVTIHTENDLDPYDKVNEIVSNITLIYHGGTMIQEMTGTSRLRGNSSLGFEKKPYRIKFDEKVRVLKGSPEESPAKAKKWTLINNHDDKTLMRNILAFEINRRFQADYTPYCQAVDVIMNGEYKGCYQLTDQITVNDERVDIAEIKPTENEEPEITGGYLLEMDALAYGERSMFVSEHGIPVTIHFPEDDEITPEQAEYIEGYFNLMEECTYSPDYQDAQKGYRSMLDMDSFLKHFLTNEFCANSDMYWSAYLYKDREDNLFKIGPVWDFNLGFDNDGRSYPNVFAHDFTYRYVVSYAGTIKNWVDQITYDPATMKEMMQMWNDVRQSGAITGESLLAYVDSMATVLDASQRLNFIRWPVLNTYIFANPQVAGSFEGEVQVVRDFIKGRITWLDDKLEYGDPYGRQTTLQISTPEDLVAFAELVNSGQKKAVGAVLTKDIDFSGYDVSIGTSQNQYYGTFDGAGHTITVGYNRNQDNAALFGYLSGLVQNLSVCGKIITSGKFAAGIAAHSYGGMVRNCASYVDIISSIQGDGTHAGIVAVTDGGGTLQNCLYAGSMKGSNTNCCGGLVGWASTTTYIINCLQIAEISVSPSGSNTISRNYGNVISTNNFYLHPFGEVGGEKSISETELHSGEVCYLMNGKSSGSPSWYQNLDNDQIRDSYPVPFDSHGTVYIGPYGFTNSSTIGSFVLKDGEDISIPYEFQISDFQYNRSFTDTDYEPLYIPVRMPVSCFTDEDVEVYFINSFAAYDTDGDQIPDEQRLEIFRLHDGDVLPNVTYIVRAKDVGTKQIFAHDVTYAGATEKSVDCNSMTYSYQFQGKYKSMTSSEVSSLGGYILQGNSLHYNFSSDLVAQRWFLMIKSLDPMYTEMPAEIKLQVATDVNAQDTYVISSAEELSEFASLVNGGQTSLNALLKADIDFTGYSQSIGSSSRHYAGIFDGAGHTITVSYNRNRDDAALFGYLGGTVKDLTVAGEIKTSAKFAAGIAAHAYSATIERCTSLVDIQSTISGDGTHAGILAVSESGIVNVSNCLYAGSMEGHNTNSCGGIVGWASASTHISNCLIIANMNVSPDNSHTLCRNYSNVTSFNNFYLFPLGDTGSENHVSQEQLSSGEICYLLNQGNNGIDYWFQTLGVDTYPVLDESHGEVTYHNSEYYNKKQEMDYYVIRDAAELTNRRKCQVQELHYLRNFSDTDYQPLYIPVSMPVSTFSNQDVQVYYLNSVNSYDVDNDGLPEIQHLEIMPILSGRLLPNVPYLIRAATIGDRDFVAYNTELYPAESLSRSCSSMSFRYSFTGVYSEVSPTSLSSQECFYFLSGNELLPVGQDTDNLCPQRWYLQILNRDTGLVSTNPSSLRIVIHGQEDAIPEIHSSHQSSSVYDLTGRQVCVPMHGIYIRGGKKVVY